MSKPVEGPPGARLSVDAGRRALRHQALAQVPELRRVAEQAGGDATLVGGPTAQEYDLRKSAARDNRVIIPLTLVVVFLILAVLLRALRRAAAARPLGDPAASPPRSAPACSSPTRSSASPASIPRCRCCASSSSWPWGSTTTSSSWRACARRRIKHGTREGTLRGLAVTGAVITGAGIVLAGTFGALAVLPLVVLTEIGFIVAFGVLLDTFIVRSVIVPALVIDVGRRVWWPSRLSRVKARDVSS